MRKALGITLMLVVVLSVSAFAKPADNTLQKFKLMDERDPVSLSEAGVFSSAQFGTTYFGGTVWAGDSLRWEAILGGTWTFDTGTGSDYDLTHPDVNPYKAAGLHGHMEGWIGVDLTYSDLPYFRLLCEADFFAEGTADTCVGVSVGLSGSCSFWCGVLPSEADELCYGNWGYGNSWWVCAGQVFAYNGTGSVVWDYNYYNETEGGWDYTYAIIDTTGSPLNSSDGDILVTAYTGGSAGSESFTLTQGVDLRSDAGDITLKFCFSSDGAWSDQDGLNPTVCGAFAFDDVEVTGGGIATGVVDFEAGAGGWALLPAGPGRGGDWSDLAHVDDLPPVLTPCDCPLVDSVLVWIDRTTGGHGLYQDNVALSPWVDIKAAGLVGSPGKFIQFDGYFELPLINYCFWRHGVQWYPHVCPFTGKLVMSDLEDDGYVYYFGGIPSCRRRADNRDVLMEYSTIVDVGAEQWRGGGGVVNFCRYYGNCSGVTNSTPWVDDVQFGVYGNPNAPFISTREIDMIQDNWPTSGNLRIDAPGRIDINNVKGDTNPAPFTVLGDTAIVSGGSGGAEVYVQFSVTPGPGAPAGLAAWLTSHPVAEVKNGETWYLARMDTAEVGASTGLGGTPSAGQWMTAYHESDPNFTGTDDDIDPTDAGPNGNLDRLNNDIFPDDLFTAGTRMNFFYKTKFVTNPGTGVTDWYTLGGYIGDLPQDTTGGTYFEVEIMPSSMAADSTFNCILYVDHADDRNAQPFIEPGLAAVHPGGSANYESTAWDRYDVHAPSSGQASLGRPLNTEYGATTRQLLGYKDIKYDCSYLSGSDLHQEDANVLIPWLSIIDPAVPEFGGNNFFASGNSIARSINSEAVTNPAANLFMNVYCGVTFLCERVGALNCPVGSPAYPDVCIDLNPAIGARVANSLPGGRTVQHLGHGNGCPTERSFDVLGLYVGGIGAPLQDEYYYSQSAAEGTDGYLAWASVTNVSLGGVDPDYKTVWDGVSLHYRRDPSDCTYNGAQAAIAERIEEVQTWFGYAGDPGWSGELGGPCEDITAGTDIPGPGRTATFKTALANFAPNPLVGGARGTIQFTMAREGKASVEIFDVSGRLIRTVFSGVAEEGLNVVHWDGRDTSERPVASGVYFYRLKANDEEFARKLVVVRNGN